MAILFPFLFLLLAALPAAALPLPGVEPFPPALAAQLQAAGGEDGAPPARYTNRLILESSPYLRQHAHNPVNWYPWGDEAFARARAENKPVLLSIGYSTCHWCHVMERESFEDEEIATFLNQNYVAIKVDREQRPDIDGVYMSALLLMTDSGGWPMTLWLTPDRKPFYGGTYFPPRDGMRGGRPGFLTLLRRLRSAYDEKKDDVRAAAEDIAARVQAEAASAAGPKSFDGGAVMGTAAAIYRQSFDAANGGFGGAPKFPRPVSLEFLLRYAHRTGDEQARAMAVKTLDAMRAGGIYDHLGGGFHRYSTDARWLVPHFEKMLYDNAQLAMVYLQAYQVTGRADFAQVARETLAYVAREMTAPEGGFWSASDADSDGIEGAFFVWTPAEIAAVLGPQRATWFGELSGVTPAGNFDGKTILHLARQPSEMARTIGVGEERFAEMAAEARRQLYEARRRRVAPHVDDKIVTSWNGLMISAFARAALVLGAAEDARRASRAAEFARTQLASGGRLRRSAVGGRAEGTGYLDDYAFLIQGLLDLFEATAEARWLSQAIELQKSLDAHFSDPAGGYFLTPDDGERLLARDKPADDGAEPAGNSVAALNLLRLTELTGDVAYRRRAEATIAAFASTLQASPVAMPAMLSALDFDAGPAKEIALLTPSPEADAGALLDVVRRTYVPNRVVVIAAEGPQLDEIARLVPWMRDKRALGGKPTAFVCENFVCGLPTSKADVLQEQLTKKSANRDR